MHNCLSYNSCKKRLVLCDIKDKIFYEKQFFNIGFNKETGTVFSIINPSDDAKMNWCNDKGLWGKIYNSNWIAVRKSKDMELISFKESEVSSKSVYSNEKVSVTVNRFFEDETFVERVFMSF